MRAHFDAVGADNTQAKQASEQASGLICQTWSSFARFFFFFFLQLPLCVFCNANLHFAFRTLNTDAWFFAAQIQLAIKQPASQVKAAPATNVLVTVKQQQAAFVSVCLSLLEVTSLLEMNSKSVYRVSGHQVARRAHCVFASNSHKASSAGCSMIDRRSSVYIFQPKH